MRIVAESQKPAAEVARELGINETILATWACRVRKAGGDGTLVESEREGARRSDFGFLLRDRDSKYTDAFDAVFEAGGLEVLLSAPQAPRMNAHCERVIGTIRREALDHILVIHEAHVRRVLAEYQEHYNAHRPHRSRDQRPPEAPALFILPEGAPRKLLRTRILGAVINQYQYAA
ncbi:integrase core domain-containing protein [Streptacidiphilus anmyonensis]|uniref:integrase core domain-containing protein n=1 Tax=Streptacidiphilus anmyonensis TaxID=405782 RepID=UPI000693EAE3